MTLAAAGTDSVVTGAVTISIGEAGTVMITGKVADAVAVHIQMAASAETVFPICLPANAPCPIANAVTVCIPAKACAKNLSYAQTKYQRHCRNACE